MQYHFVEASNQVYQYTDTVVDSVSLCTKCSNVQISHFLIMFGLTLYMWITFSSKLGMTSKVQCHLDILTLQVDNCFIWLLRRKHLES